MTKTTAAIAIDTFVGIKAPAGFTATASNTFVVATTYDDVAEMTRVVDEAIDEDALAERAGIWAAVAKTEACYHDAGYDALFLKCDGREG